MRRTNSLEKTLMLGKMKVGGEGDNRGWDGWIPSLTQWTWVWVNSGCWWWTGRTGVLQSMGSQSWTQRSNWTELYWEGKKVERAHGDNIWEAFCPKSHYDWTIWWGHERALTSTSELFSLYYAPSVNLSWNPLAKITDFMLWALWIPP